MGYKQSNKFFIVNSLSSANPIDATQYTLNANWTSGISGLYGFKIPFDCILKRADITIYSGVTGTAEDWTISIFKNSVLASDIATLGAATSYREWDNDAMNINFSKDDVLHIITTTPTWVTNPTGCLTQYILAFS